MLFKHTKNKNPDEAADASLEFASLSFIFFFFFTFLTGFFFFATGPAALSAGSLSDSVYVVQKQNNIMLY